MRAFRGRTLANDGADSDHGLDQLRSPRSWPARLRSEWSDDDHYRVLALRSRQRRRRPSTGWWRFMTRSAAPTAAVAFDAQAGHGDRDLTVSEYVRLDLR